jgi:thiol:disulfide interchange protein
MKKIFLGIIAAALIGFAFTSNTNSQKTAKQTHAKGIEFFDGSWAEAKLKAKKEGKLIFMDAYASWCGPCKMMAKNTFTDEKVAEFFNKNFINVKMDMEKHKEGPRLSKKYGLRAYPTLYFLNNKEEIVHQSIGYLKPGQLIEQGKMALNKN